MKLYVNEIVRTNNFEDDDIMNKILGMWDTFYKNNDDYKGKVYAGFMKRVSSCLDFEIKNRLRSIMVLHRLEQTYKCALVIKFVKKRRY